MDRRLVIVYLKLSSEFQIACVDVIASKAVAMVLCLGRLPLPKRVNPRRKMQYHRDLISRPHSSQFDSRPAVLCAVSVPGTTAP